MEIDLASYKHDHPEVRNINEIYESSVSPGQRIAEKLTTLVGSWPFIVFQSAMLVLWIGFNIYFLANPGMFKAFDPYPFILLNLALSFQAAYTGPIVLMSQNRQVLKDRLMAQSDFECNLTAETEIRLIMEHLKRQDVMLRKLLSESSADSSED